MIKAYRSIDWKNKALIGTAILLATTTIAWRMTGEILIPAAITALVLLTLHLLITYLAWAGVILIGTISLISITQAIVVFSMVAPYSVFYTATILLFSSITTSVLAYRYARGRYWLNLLVTQFLNIWAGSFIATVLPYYAVIFIGPALSLLYIYLRASKITKRKKTNTLEQEEPSPNRKARLKKHAQSQEAIKIYYPPIDTYDGLAFTKNLRAAVIHDVTLAGRITQGKTGQTHVNGQDITDELAHKIAISTAVSHKYRIPQPATIILTNDPALRKGEIIINVSTREGKNIGKVALAHYLNIEKTLPQTINDIAAGQATLETVQSIAHTFNQAAALSEEGNHNPDSIEKEMVP